jgi:hypothetical protein
VDSLYYKLITDKLKHFSEETDKEMSIKFDMIRLGTKYENNSALILVKSISNCTIISLSGTFHNIGVNNIW